MEAECRYCFHLAPHADAGSWMKDAHGMSTWRCPFGRFDRKREEHTFKCYFAWSGIWVPNNEVAKAQADCKRFEVHPRAGEFTKTKRVLP